MCGRCFGFVSEMQRSPTSTYGFQKIKFMQNPSLDLQENIPVISHARTLDTVISHYAPSGSEEKVSTSLTAAERRERRRARILEDSEARMKRILSGPDGSELSYFFILTFLQLRTARLLPWKVVRDFVLLRRSLRIHRSLIFKFCQPSRPRDNRLLPCLSST